MATRIVAQALSADEILTAGRVFSFALLAYFAMEGKMNIRILELLDLAAAENITLPMTPEEIIALEDAGHVVDLRTGEVLECEADVPYVWEWTAYGEAMAHLLSSQSEV